MTTSAKNKATRKIIDGPSKWDLAVALFDPKVLNRHNVRFTVEKPSDVRGARLIPDYVTVSINSMQIKGSSGESWNIEGVAMKEFGDGQKKFPGCPQRVFIYFRTGTRKGHIRFLGE